MKPRILLAPLGVAAVVAYSLAPAVTATAATPSPPTSSAAQSTRVGDTVYFQTANGEAATGGIFKAGDGPVDFFVTGGSGGHLRVYETKTGKTVCEADSTTTGRGRYHCITENAFDYGLTSLTVEVTNSDGTIDSESVGGARVVRYYEGSTLSIDSYDPATQVAHISGTSKPGADYTISAYRQEWDVLTQSKVTDEGTWSAVVTDVAPSTRLRFGLDINGGLADVVERLPASEPVPSPVITSLTKNGNGFNLYAMGPVGAGMKVKTGDGETLSYATVGANGQAYLYFTDPKVEREISVVTQIDGLESAPVTTTINEGVGSAKPKAPTVNDAAMVGSRMTATVAAEPGAVIKVTDTTGKVVAVKVAGTNGSAQVLFAVPNGRAAGSYEVTQTQAGATSAPTTIPAATR